MLIMFLTLLMFSRPPEVRRRVRARGAGSARGTHRLGEPPHLRLDGVSEHAGDVVPPRVSVDCAAGFIVAVLLGPGVEQVADRVALPARPRGDVRGLPPRSVTMSVYISARVVICNACIWMHAYMVHTCISGLVYPAVGL